jgi:hypothetical protein
MHKLRHMLVHDVRDPTNLARRLLRKATAPFRLAALPGRIRRSPVLNLHRIDDSNLGDLNCGPTPCAGRSRIVVVSPRVADYSKVPMRGNPALSPRHSITIDICHT